jgi:hypothetical protein
MIRKLQKFNLDFNNLLKEIVYPLTRLAEEIIADRCSIDEAQHSQRAKWPFRQCSFIKYTGY